jgi:hypothetical protein
MYQCSCRHQAVNRLREREACHILLPGVTVAPESQWRTAL